MWSRRWRILAGATALAGVVCGTVPACGGTPQAARDLRAASQDPRGTATPLALSGPVVALGDSYTAGLLLPLSLSSDPLGCLRSTASYPVRVASALEAKSFVDAACASAGVADMTSPQATAVGTNRPQLDALSADDSVVMLTLGGDDLGFSRVLDTCMLLSVTDPSGSPCESYYTAGGGDQLAAKIAAEAPKIRAVLTTIRAKAPRARVLVVGYPDVFPQRGGCWPVVPITAGDVAYLRSAEIRLNAMLASAAKAAGVTYVDTYRATIGHDACRNASVKDVEGLIPTSAAYSFHPNARGQEVMAGRVLAALRS